MNKETTEQNMHVSQHISNDMLPAVLRLTLKKKWFDMIAAGIKKEEYREVKPYWISRLSATPLTYFYEWSPNVDFRGFKYVEFKNGYSKSAPTMILEIKEIKIGTAVPEWSDNWQGECFVISLGKIVKPAA